MTMVERRPCTAICATLTVVILLATVVAACPQGPPVIETLARTPVLLVLTAPPTPSESGIPGGQVTPPAVSSTVELVELADGCWPESLFEDVAGLMSEAALDKSFADFSDRGLPSDFIDPASVRPGDLPLRNPSMLNPPDSRGTKWGNVAAQSLFFVGVMHAWRLAVEPDTRAALDGPFFKDYWNAVRQLRGWSDGDSTLTNYIGHPMMGSIAGRILLQNQPASRDLQPGWDRQYAKSMLKAFGYSFAFSVQWEVGLISEGTIGNATPNQYSNHPFSYIDLVVTPTLGTVWTIGEDLLDKYVIRRIERKTDNRAARLFARSLLNPTRSFANLMRIKKPWYRDDRSL
jgi:hypothetical protein